MHARVSTYEMGGRPKEDAARAFEQAVQGVQQLDGNQGGMLLVGEDGSRAMTITFWESADALRASEEQANQMREQAAGGAGITIADVSAYEVALEFGR